MSKEIDEKLEGMGVQAMGPPWYQRLVLRIAPKLFIRTVAHKAGVKQIVFDRAHELFSRVERIDLFPCGGTDGRGLIMVLDRKTALFFYQDEDHFSYDGFEMGDYEKGDVTAFDRIKNPPSPYA